MRTRGVDKGWSLGAHATTPHLPILFLNRKINFFTKNIEVIFTKIKNLAPSLFKNPVYAHDEYSIMDLKINFKTLYDTK